MSRYARARVLVVAGSDSSGGAGFQADCKVITALGGYAASAITALTAQNTLGVHGVFEVPADFVRAQMRAVIEDIGADALKSGMLVDTGIIEAVAEEISNSLKGGRKIPYVLDPVMVAKGGAALLSPDAVGKLREALVPLADVVTPNIPEAGGLTGITIRNESDARKAGEALLKMGAKAALVKGGHGEGKELVDVLVTKEGKSVRFPNKRIDTVHTHGTGCSLASAIAVLLARGLRLHEAVEQALAHVRRGIVEAPEFGKGHGPIAHAFD